MITNISTTSKKDRIESNDLASTHPKKLEQMKAEFARLDQELNDGRALKKMPAKSGKKKKK